MIEVNLANPDQLNDLLCGTAEDLGLPRHYGLLRAVQVRRRLLGGEDTIELPSLDTSTRTRVTYRMPRWWLHPLRRVRAARMRRAFR